MKHVKNALKRLSYGVYVVSVRHGDRVNAMTMRMISQVSSRPPLIALAVAKRRYSHNLIRGAGAFAINVLAEGQEPLGGHFGLRIGQTFNKMAGVDYRAGESTGAPILKECCAFMECRVVAAHEVGNSTLFIAEVVNAGVHDSGPLHYKEADYFG